MTPDHRRRVGTERATSVTLRRCNRYAPTAIGFVLLAVGAFGLSCENTNNGLVTNPEGNIIMAWQTQEECTCPDETRHFPHTTDADPTFSKADLLVLAADESCPIEKRSLIRVAYEVGRKP